MTKREDEMIKKTYTHEDEKGCSVIYHAFTTKELEWFERLKPDEQRKFEKTILDNHMKNCPKKAMDDRLNKEKGNAPSKP